MTRPPEVPVDRSPATPPGLAKEPQNRAGPPGPGTGLGSTKPPMATEQIRIETGEREVEVVNDTPPDPRAVIEDLRRRLREEQEKTLNSVDAVMGARAAAAQAKAETQDVFYRLHVRETELAQLKELLAEMGGDADDGMDSSPTPTVAAKTLLASVKRAVSDR